MLLEKIEKNDKMQDDPDSKYHFGAVA
jgi:hypothetical protein